MAAFRVVACAKIRRMQATSTNAIISVCARVFLQLNNTWFMEPELVANSAAFQFLCKCITASLVCQGFSVVVGDNRDQVEKMMRTLALLHPEHRLLSLRAHSFNYNPYIRGLLAQYSVKFIKIKFAGIQGLTNVCLH